MRTLETWFNSFIWKNLARKPERERRKSIELCEARVTHKRSSTDACQTPPARRKNRREATSDAPCLIINLPTVIVQRIASHLPLSSKAALALTARCLHHAIGTQSWRALGEHLQWAFDKRDWTKRTARANFLELLERDWAAEFYLCPDCLFLHSKFASPSESDRQRHRYPCMAYQNSLYDWRYVTLPWAYVHLAMKRHFRGEPFGLPLSRLSGDMTKPPLYSGSVRRFSLQGKIVNNELLVQGCLSIEVGHDLRGCYFRICDHLNSGDVYLGRLGSWGEYEDSQFKSVLDCRLSHYAILIDNCAICRPKLRSCDRCGVEYNFQVSRTFRGRRLNIQTWANLGSCRTPGDLKWIAAVERERLLPARNLDMDSVQALDESN